MSFDRRDKIVWNAVDISVQCRAVALNSKAVSQVSDAKIQMELE